MAKVKWILFTILAIVLVDFAVENGQPVPELKLFKFQLGVIPTYLLVYISLAVGLVVGWIAFGVRTRRKRRRLEAATAASAEQRQESEAHQTEYEAK